MTDRPAKPVRRAAPLDPPPPPKGPATVPRADDRTTTRRLDPLEELEVLIRARYPIIYVVSWEEERVERYLREIAQKRNKSLFVWTVTQGIDR